MAIVTGTIVLGTKILLAIISFLISYGILIAKVVLCWGSALLLTFWVLKNFAAVGESFDLLEYIDRLFQEGIQCDYSTRDGQLVDNNPAEINDVNNQVARALFSLAESFVAGPTLSSMR